MRERLWATVHKIAAELVVYHKTTSDVNLIEKTMHHIINTKSDIGEVREWLNAQMKYAEYFERSKQSRPQLATTLAVVDEYTDQVVSMDELAEALGFTVRLVRYYVQRRGEAQKLVPSPTLVVPDPPALAPVRRPVSSTKDSAILRPESKETSKAAEDIFGKLQSMWQQNEAEDEEEPSRKQKRNKKKK
jgi:hypothetical protein